MRFHVGALWYTPRSVHGLLREGSMVGMGDVGILVEEIEDDEVDEVI